MRTFCLTMVLLVPWSLGAAPATLVNLLPDRPVFSYVTGGFTQTRALAPGQRLSLEPGNLSGAGARRVLLAEGSTYYFARFGALPRLYVLGGDQVLVLNRSDRTLTITLDQGEPVTGTVAAGSFALGQTQPGQPLTVRWTGEAEGSQEITGGRVYQLALGSPDGVGLTVTLTPWD